MPDFNGPKASGGDPSLNEINRADRFLDALAGKQPVYSTDHAEAELAFLLADWRDTIRDPAPTVPVTARDAVTALNDGLAKRHSRGSWVIAGSTAAAMLCIGGFGAAIYGADPGSTFYGARTALFGNQRVSDDEVMLAARTEMAQVQTLIDQGQWEQAQTKLQQLSPTVQSVDTPEHKQQLIQQWNALTYKVVEQNPEATLPPAGEPMPVLPSSPLTLLPVPVIVPPGGSHPHPHSHDPDASTSTTTSTSETSGTETSTSGPTETTGSSSTGTSTSGTSSSATSSESAVPQSPSSTASSTASSTQPSSTASSAPPESSSAPARAGTTSSEPTATPTTTSTTVAPTSTATSTQVTTSVTITPSAVPTSPTSIPSTAATTPTHEAPATHDAPSTTKERPSHGSDGSGSGQHAGAQSTASRGDTNQP